MYSRLFTLLIVLLGLWSCQSGDNQRVTGEYILNSADLPQYEQNIDHDSIISSWAPGSYRKGMIAYRNHCYSCHGNIEQQGSLPNSRQFWKEEFRNGSDPYSLYQTLTRGSGSMAPQVHLTPREKYEVIHFIREEFLKEHNPGQYFEIDDEYLAALPKGSSMGPDPKPYKPWAEMDYGNFLIQAYEVADSEDPPKVISGGRSPLPNEDYRDVNFAYKGIAIRLDAGEGGVAVGNAFVMFDHDLMRMAGFWTGEGFIDYESILLNDMHNIYPRTVGKLQVENPVGPGWAHPETGRFTDDRFVAVDGRPFGPLDRDWAHYKGLYTYGEEVVIRYTVGNAEVLEKYDLVSEDPPVLSRNLNISKMDKSLKMRIAPHDYPVQITGVGAELVEEDGFHVMRVEPGEKRLVRLFLGARSDIGEEPEDLEKFTRGGPAMYTQTLTSQVIKGNDKDAYAVDVISLPFENPWKSRMRPTGIDFLENGDEAVVCTIDGEVWRLGNITDPEGPITWKRIATGLFQPLGIKVREGEIFVTCRDQLVRLDDLNGDGETDYYEGFNSDHQVTEHFHEFAMGLQTDAEGNFYYAKSGRHARTSLVPQHGTLIRVSADGKTSEILANGFRAANGVCINPDGSFIVTDQEGYWNPMNRINWVEKGGFYGNMWGYGPPSDSSDAAMEDPLVWIDREYDRSPAELLWAESDRWGSLEGKLLSLSYGNGKIFEVMIQEVDGKKQGAFVELPVPQFPTGIMRGRFNPADGQLYVAGMSAWATNQMIQVGGLYRVRYTGEPLDLPVGMEVFEEGLRLTFSDPLDEASLSTDKLQVNAWDLLRSRRYGSDRLNERTYEIEAISLSPDGKTLELNIPDIGPSWCLEVMYDAKSAKGKEVRGALQGTVYQIRD